MPLFKKKTTEGEKAIIQVRAGIAILFSLSLIGGFFMNLISEETFMPVAIMAISWYFSKRDSEENAPKKEDN